MEISDKIIFSHPLRKARLIYIVMSITVLALSLGIIISYRKPFEANYSLVVATIFLTLGFSFLASLLIVFLEEPGKYKKIPRGFFEEAMRQLYRTQFYRTDCKVNFFVENSELHFNSYSSLMQMQQGTGTTIPYPSGDIPNNLELALGPIYYRDEIEQPKNQPIEIGRKERVRIEYKILEREIEDTHNWKSPVHGFELTARLPLGSKMEVFALSSSSSGYGEKSIDNSYPNEGGWLFRYDKPLFPHQGFRWKITLPSNSR